MEAQGLGINFFYLAGQIVNFALLAWILNKLLYKPIIRKLEERALATEKSQELVEELTKRQEKWEEKQAKEIKKTQAKTKEILNQARGQAEQEKAKIISLSKEEARHAAENEYEKYAQKLAEQEKKLKQHIADIAVAAARKVLAGHLDKKAQDEILKKQIKNLSKLTA